MEYNFRDIEKKWQKQWVDHKTYQVKEDESKQKFYVLNMFPYPSGAGLHVGHPLGYIASDIYARYKRLQGFNVLNPMGYDAYGLPAEQYAIQTGQHPAITTEKNINRYREQLDKIGFSFACARCSATTRSDASAICAISSVSAFCNAGIDLLGVRGAYSSLTSYAYDPLINLVIILLIVIGGIGFLTWDDIYRNRHHISRYRMQSKVILSYSLALIFIPAILFFFLEFQDIPAGKRILVSLFQSVTTRTAGFNTADLSSMRESGQFLMILLMLVGGSPGSTAGGIKTTTLAVLISCATAVFARKDSPEMFKRRIIPDIVATAIAILFMYTSLGVLRLPLLGDLY